MAYNTIQTKTEGRVGVITLDRPSALNALCDELTAELADALAGFERDEEIGCVVLTGSAKAFAAGADIKELQGKDFISLYKHDPFAETWESVARFRKPIIAAVSGYALGGGLRDRHDVRLHHAPPRPPSCGQPEINLGVMPGAGRHAAPAARRWQGEGDGHVLDRAHDAG